MKGTKNTTPLSSATTSSTSRSFTKREGSFTTRREESEYNLEWDQLRNASQTSMDKLTRWQSFKLFLWDPKKRTFCRLSGTSWAFILVFYTLFAGMVVVVFYGIVRIINYCIKTNAKTPIVEKASLTKDPTYI